MISTDPIEWMLRTVRNVSVTKAIVMVSACAVIFG